MSPQSDPKFDHQSSTFDASETCSSKVRPLKHLTIAIIGGGAAGYFAAITAAEANRAAQVTIYEASKRTLTKVKISGGGRCNVTHQCFDPKELATRYPRGARELRGAFHRWQPQDTIDWFEKRGVQIKAEPDGRMFPISDDSQTIIDCFHGAAQRAGVELRKEIGLKTLSQNPDQSFTLHLSDHTQVRADKVLIAAGSLKASPLTRALEALGHSIAPLAPSLFAFNLADKRTHDLAGLSVQNASITHVEAPPQGGRLSPTAAAEGGRLSPTAATEAGRLSSTAAATQGGRLSPTAATEAGRLSPTAATQGGPLSPTAAAIQGGRLSPTAATEPTDPPTKPKTKFKKPAPQTGPILITHRGLSGPAILRLSAWQARALQDENYHFEIQINWLGKVSENQIREQFNRLRKGKTQVKSKVFEQIPRRLWERLVATVGIPEDLKWAQLPRDKETALIQELLDGHYQVQGKTTNKDEFVTCGGVSLKEINFKTMESKLVPNLHFAGECLDIDGITGGFNFQAAWTGGRIAGQAMADSV